MSETTTSYHTYSHQCRTEEGLTDLVRRFWEQEEIPTTSAMLFKVDQECENHYVRTHSQGKIGHYIVRLPLIDPLLDFAGTRRAASRLLQYMENRFAHDPSFHTLYADFMRQYSELGHMMLAPSNDAPASRVFYLPHHSVMREVSTTTKL